MSDEKKSGESQVEAVKPALEQAGVDARVESVGNGGYFQDLDFSKLNVSLEEMFKCGVHFGHHKSRKNPKMAKYIFGTKNGINIIDLEKTVQKLEEATKFISELVAENKEIMLVGTKKQAKSIIESAAIRCGVPYVAERWLGGTFTNFSVISARTRFLREGQEKMERGEYAKYTKFEQMKINEELHRLERRMGGIKNMRVLPSAIFVTGIIEDKLAIAEARRKGIPVLALCDTNVDPEGIDYPIPGNDDAVSSLRLMLAYISKAILDGKEKAKAKARPEEKEKK